MAENSKHIKVVTRDRASAYAKVIAEELPDAMQVVDRFHLYQNLLEAVEKALNQHLPATIMIPHEKRSEDLGNPCKKTLPVWITAWDFLKNVIKWSAKYRERDPRELSVYGIRQSKIAPFYDTIIKGLQAEWSKSQTVKEIYAEGYDGSLSNAFDHLVKI